jgi:hypothetical protein
MAQRGGLACAAILKRADVTLGALLMAGQDSQSRPAPIRCQQLPVRHSNCHMIVASFNFRCSLFFRLVVVFRTRSAGQTRSALLPRRQWQGQQSSDPRCVQNDDAVQKQSCADTGPEHLKPCKVGYCWIFSLEDAIVAKGPLRRCVANSLRASSISSISLEPVFTSSISSIFHCGPAAHS